MTSGQREVRETDAEDSAAGREILSFAVARFRRDKQVRRTLPADGTLFIDRRVPFLIVHRVAAERVDHGLVLLARSFASHLVISAEYPALLNELCEQLLNVMIDEFGAGLVVELTSNDERKGEDGRVVRVIGPPEDRDVVRTLTGALDGIELFPRDEVPEGQSQSAVEASVEPGPGRLSLSGRRKSGRASHIGVEVPPSYRDPRDGNVFHERLSLARRNLTRALEEGVHQWIREHGSPDLDSPPHPYALARRNPGRTARAVAKRVAGVADAFDLILGVSPTNSGALWDQFQRDRCERAPRFRYRPLPFDPERLKRSLFAVPLERIEDPLLGSLIREKQEELDLQISMLRLRGRPEFRLGSLQIFGRPDRGLVELAGRVLECHDPLGKGDPQERTRREWVDAHAFAEMARAELEHLSDGQRGFPTGIDMRSDLSSGLVVSRGLLCISDSLKVTANRARALVQHEVGTHVVTHYNGTRQPLRLLASGLAGYGALQEGLAVLSEHLVGGLTPGRLRTLGARVLAVDAMVEGGDFVQAFRSLTERGVQGRKAFMIVLRVYRGGGLTKDFQYLEGLRDVLEYVKNGGDPAPLFVGKIGLSHLDIVAELMMRGTLRKPAVWPRYMNDEDALRRLEECRGKSVLDLCREVSK